VFSTYRVNWLLQPIVCFNPRRKTNLQQGNNISRVGAVNQNIEYQFAQTDSDCGVLKHYLSEMNDRSNLKGQKGRIILYGSKLLQLTKKIYLHTLSKK